MGEYSLLSLFDGLNALLELFDDAPDVQLHQIYALNDCLRLPLHFAGSGNRIRLKRFLLNQRRQLAFKNDQPVYLFTEFPLNCSVLM
jgi:hypothetical protein